MPKPNDPLNIHRLPIASRPALDPKTFDREDVFEHVHSEQDRDLWGLMRVDWESEEVLVTKPGNEVLALEGDYPHIRHPISYFVAHFERVMSAEEARDYRTERDRHTRERAEARRMRKGLPPSMPPTQRRRR